MIPRIVIIALVREGDSFFRPDTKPPRFSIKVTQTQFSAPLFRQNPDNGEPDRGPYFYRHRSIVKTGSNSYAASY